MATRQSVEHGYALQPEPERQWYLIHTKPLAEHTAQTNLERQGYETYLPRLIQIARRQQRWSESIVPLFPRYLFLHLDAAQQSLRPVHSTVGVCNLVRFGTHCAAVPESVVEELRGRADPATGLHRLKAAARFARGTRVRITAGPFCGIDGIFERAEAGERVLILLKLLGRDTPIEFPTELVANAAF